MVTGPRCAARSLQYAVQWPSRSMRLMAVARPVISSTLIKTDANMPGPSATSMRCGNPVKNLPSEPSVSIPMIESYGPVIPTSLT